MTTEQVVVLSSAIVATIIGVIFYCLPHSIPEYEDSYSMDEENTIYYMHHYDFKNLTKIK